METKPATQAVRLEQDGNIWRLMNEFVGLRFNLSNYTYSVFLPATGEIVIADATLEGNRWNAARRVAATGRPEWTQLPDGIEVTFAIAYHHEPIPEYLFRFVLHDGDGAIRMGFGMRNHRDIGLRLMNTDVLSGGQLKLAFEQPVTLNGGAGAAETLVQPGLKRECENSLMLTGLVAKQRRTLVWGGLANRDFGKWAAIGPKSRREPAVTVLSLKADDPVGRLVDPGQTYWAEDTFYLDVTTADPFAALEKYGRAMREANHAAPKVYDFPVLCGWSVGALSKLPNINNSRALVAEMDAAVACGLTKYTKVGIRLEPDKYLQDTEQGWWDDEHWAKHGHLVPPYETMAKFCRAITERGGIPYTYFQVGMPSDDYARAFPGHMLNNDISKLAVWHHHHQPLVSFDYTDPDFQKHMLSVWQRLRRDGMRGIKFDYPETGWRPEGGFEDKYATTASAYREVFRLAREGLGAEAFLDERNLGESGRPCLDVTAGLVDTQRNWADSNAFVARMVTIGGLRWYKNRTVFNYFPDTKTVHDLTPEVRRSMLTMMFLTSGRLDLATSFTLFTPEIVHDFTRIYPMYREPFSARPLDAFTGGDDPQVYDLELTPDWHQVALFNAGQAVRPIPVPLSGDRASTGAMGLDPAGEYYVYDFWADRLVGKLPGTAVIERELEPLHCAMLSVRKVQPHPQVISTNRHVLQGWVELADVQWDAAGKKLSGKAVVIGGEPLRIVVAGNGRVPVGASGRLEEHPAGNDYRVLVLECEQTTEMIWAIQF